MRKLLVIAIMATLFIGFLAPAAMCEDKVLEFTIGDMVEKLDKNGAQYVRFISQESRTIDGITYPKGIPVMAFGEIAPQLAAYSNGDTIKCVVTTREYQGRESYTILAIAQ
jgi:hypothetical protein